MTVMFRVRFPDGVEGDVLQHDLGEYTESARGLTGTVEIRVAGHIALVQLDDGTLTSRTRGHESDLKPACTTARRATCRDSATRATCRDSATGTARRSDTRCARVGSASTSVARTVAGSPSPDGETLGDFHAEADGVTNWRTRRERRQHLFWRTTPGSYDEPAYEGFDPDKWQRFVRRVARFLMFVDRRRAALRKRRLDLQRELADVEARIAGIEPQHQTAPALGGDHA